MTGRVIGEHLLDSNENIGEGILGIAGVKVKRGRLVMAGNALGA